MKNPYEVLGVSQNASDEEIKRAYKDLARKWHPDINKNKNAEAKFKEINSAYDLVKDGKSWSPHGNRLNIEDLFNQTFGGRFSGGFGFGFQNEVRKNRGQIKVSFEEAHSGCEKTIHIRNTHKCSKCRGLGFEQESSACAHCRGSGKIGKQHGPVQVFMSCPMCKGLGRKIGNSCSECSGSGEKSSVKDVNIKIPPNTLFGSTISVSSELDVIILYHEHSEFTLSENRVDVISSTTIGAVDAILGTEIIVNTLFGKKKVKINAGIQPDTTLRINKCGFKSVKQGDHLLVVKIKVPKNITEKQKQLLVELKKSFEEKNDKN